MSLMQPLTWDLQVSRLHENVDQSSSCRTAGQSLGTNQQIDVWRSDEVGNTSVSPLTPSVAEDGSLRERAPAGLQLTKASWEGKRDKPESFTQQDSGKASKTFQQDGNPHPQDHHETDPKAQLAKGPANASEVIAYADLLRSRRKVAEAMSLYDCVLAVDPRSADALVGKGACLQQQAQPRAAFACFVGALALNPANVQALTRCGIFYTEEGHLLEGIEAFRKALTLNPSFGEAKDHLAIVLTDLGTRFKLSGNAQEGIKRYYEAIEVNPRCAPAYYNLGVVYSEMGQYGHALSFYEKAAQLRPLYAEAHCNMGVIYKDRGDLLAAIACYERCLMVAPNFTIARNNLAIALTDLGTKVKLEGNLQQGIAYYKRALVYNSHYADAMYNLGVAYGEMLNFDMAIVMYELALHFNPQCAEACNNLGVIYKDRDNLDKAVECYTMALRIKPSFSQSLNNLGVVYTVQGKMDAALTMIQAALAASPGYSEAYNNLGVLHRDAGNIPAAIKAYEQCLSLDPDSRNAGQNRLLALNYIHPGDDDSLFVAHRDWGRRFCALYPKFDSWPNSKDPSRPIVVGYISPDFFTHSVSYFIEAPLAHHDPGKFKIIVYSAVVKADAKTLRFRETVLSRGGVWKDVFGADEKLVAQEVRNDGVDILVELTGHTANNKLGVLACKPAPVQVTWIGYPNTTGLSTVDYRITDELADPCTSKQRHVETPLRLPRCFLCYTPSLEAGPVAPTPALSNGFVTFGSFNNLAKITPGVLKLWARILKALPGARLVVKCKPFSCPSISERFMSALEAEGVDPVRIDLLPLILLNHDHMQSYALMDISLDTFPYAGTTTTCESLYMGVPCVTMAGGTHSHNVGVTLLKQLGLESLTAYSPDEYVDIAVRLASDLPRLAAMRAGMRDRMLPSPLCDGPTFVRDLEAAYRRIWRDYCGGRTPSEGCQDQVCAQDVAPPENEELPRLVQRDSSGSSNESPTSSLFLRTDDSGGSLDEVADEVLGKGKTPSRLRKASG